MHTVGLGIAFCTPVPHIPIPGGGTRLAPISTEWHRARLGLATPTNMTLGQLYVDGMEVGEARCKAVELLLETDPAPEFLMFLDYDVIPSFDAVTKLFYRARHYPEYEIFGGVYCCKTIPSDPLIYKGDGHGPFWDWAIGDLLFDITSMHMGLTLIRSSLFKRMLEAGAEPLFHTVNEVTNGNGRPTVVRGTEDIFFCNKAVNDFGAKILIDTSVLAGHIDHRSGMIYGLPKDSKPVQGAHWIDSKDEHKKALDIGAGGTRRHWEGYKTYTTDIRPDSKPDHVMDTRMLNFPDESWDLVASSHHLEHLGRWDQENVWQEMSRILKPGGRMEHVIPNVEWAADQIQSGECNGSAWDVLYGAQEAMPIERDWNTHYFAYTPKVAKAMAEEVAGLKDVTIETYKDKPELGYNLILRGEKPNG